MKTAFAILVLVGFGAFSAHADYLEIRRSANIKAAPERDSRTLEKPAVGTLLELLDKGKQQNGYYHTQTPTAGDAGWIYRTLVRRHRGEIPDSAKSASSIDFSAARPPKTFDGAKPVAIRLWWDIGATSFYCGCAYRPATSAEKKMRSGNLWVGGDGCTYKPRNAKTLKGKLNARASRIEWEHVVPADWIATGFGCQKNTRKECRAIKGYEEAEGDLFNLVPAIGEINGDRNARLYGEISGDDLKYGSCDFEVITTGPGEPHVRGAAEPKPSIRGDVARIWFYMRDRYGVKISSSYEKLLNAWSVADPVDDAEIARHAHIAAKMGWTNPFVEQ